MTNKNNNKWPISRLIKSGSNLLNLEKKIFNKLSFYWLSNGYLFGATSLVETNPRTRLALEQSKNTMIIKKNWQVNVILKKHDNFVSKCLMSLKFSWMKIHIFFVNT